MCIENLWGRAVDKGGDKGSAPSPPPFLGTIFFFHVKSENAKLLHVNNMWDFSLCIEQEISDKKQIVFPEFVVLAVDWATTVTNNEIVSFYF